MRNDDTVGHPFSDDGRGEPSTRDIRSEAPVAYEDFEQIPLSRRKTAWQPLSILAAAVIVVLGVIVPNPFTALTPERDAGNPAMVSESIARHRMTLPGERPSSTARAIPEISNVGVRSSRAR